MSCHPKCHKPTGVACHCSTCHQTFGSITYFDAHRKGGDCIPPHKLKAGLTLRNGVWRKPDQREHDESGLEDG